MDYPTFPPDRVIAIHEERERQLDCWRITPDPSSRWNDNGILKYEYSFLEYSAPPDESAIPGQGIRTGSVNVYRVKTDYAVNIIQMKALEAALEKFW